MYKIGEFSKLAKTTIKTLRFYEKEKLLIPSFVDEIYLPHDMSAMDTHVLSPPQYVFSPLLGVLPKERLKTSSKVVVIIDELIASQ